MYFGKRFAVILVTLAEAAYPLHAEVESVTGIKIVCEFSESDLQVLKNQEITGITSFFRYCVDGHFVGEQRIAHERFEKLIQLKPGVHRIITRGYEKTPPPLCPGCTGYLYSGLDVWEFSLSAGQVGIFLACPSPKFNNVSSWKPIFVSSLGIKPSPESSIPPSDMCWPIR
jgi:hypothetical protein